MPRPVDSPLGVPTLAGPVETLTTGRRSTRASLLLFHRDQVQLLTLAEGQKVVVGRGPGAEVVIEDQALSRRHASFELLSGEVWVEDLCSTNGTRLDGFLIERERLQPGGEVRLGNVGVSLHVRPGRQLAPVADRHEDFQRALEEEALRARTFHRSFALLLVRLPADVDALRAPDALRAVLRPVDRLARYSDAMIEILLVEGDEALGRAVAARARAALGGGQSALVLCPPVAPNEAIGAGLAALRRCTDDQPMEVVASRASAGGEEVAAGTMADSAIVANAEMAAIYETVERLAGSAIPVLLVGETGSGKEVVARALHEGGPRGERSLASINCGAIPSTLVESVLFGHVKGAFTGAVADSPGLFEEADGGTVFLDEIGELSPSAQAALLRVLETKKIRRVGSNAEIEVDARVIAATHRDLEAMCQEGSFRQDLLYRINTMVLEIPPLRDRPEEILPLAERFLREANEANHSAIEGITPEAIQALLRHAWPGNVRELRNVIERAVVIARGMRIGLEDLPRSLRDDRVSDPLARLEDAAPPAAQPSRGEGPTAAGDFKSKMEQHERQLLLDALRQAGGNRAEAAKLLQMPVRTLSHKLNQHGIKKDYVLD